MIAPPSASTSYDPSCRACPRLADYLSEAARLYPEYHCAPVPPFGTPAPSLIVVGLAPGMHGANASGRPFTGDHAGILLYETLHAIGRATRPASVAVDDGLELVDCRITNAVKCVPPKNRPVGAEIRRCNAYLAAELGECPRPIVIVALGRVAHEAVLDALGEKRGAHPFAHAAEHVLPGGVTLVDSYHCSRYNQNTRRLTPEMFRAVLERADTLARQRRRT